MNWKSVEGSTAQLLKLCLGYFIGELIYGTATKWFTEGGGGMNRVEYLVYCTMGGMTVCLTWVLLNRWWKRPEGQALSAMAYIIPSGICTAIVIPTTTMMYLLPISVMVAMVVMRSGVIIIGRIVDAIQTMQGILHKKVYWQENVGVVLALLATSTILFGGVKGDDFNFIQNRAAMTILTFYLVAYGIRIYIMNYYKNTRPKGVNQNNKWFFAVEQITASTTIVLIALCVSHLPEIMDLTRTTYDYSVAEQAKAAGTDPVEAVYVFANAFRFENAIWYFAMLAGCMYGFAAFFSVFLFMFKGRTATFSNLINRLTSLMAGTFGTLVFAVGFGGKYPKPQNWVSLAIVITAFGFLMFAEKRRVAELKAAHEIDERAGADRRAAEDRRTGADRRDS